MIPHQWLLIGGLACPLVIPLSLYGEVGKPKKVTEGV